MARITGLVMLLIEAMFLSERFPMIFRDVLRHHAGFYEAFFIFVLNIPQIFDLALPIAFLVATYRAVIDMREGRELLVMGAAGMGPRGLLAPCFGLACAAAMTSFFVAGVINPLSLYAQRVVLFNAQSLALSGGSATGQFYVLEKNVVFAPATRERAELPGQKRNLFIYEPNGDSCVKIILAGSARSETPEIRGVLSLFFDNVSWRIFDMRLSSAAASPCPVEAESFTSGDRRVRLSELLSFQPRGFDGSELTSPELLGMPSEPGLPDAGKLYQIQAERIGRILLCFMAPALACAAVCLTSRRMQYVVLPVACGGLMSLDLGFEWIVHAGAFLHEKRVIAELVLMTIGGCVSLIFLTWRLQNTLFRPQFGRA
ncbi:LptF/LptG family permease [Acetobacter sp.]|uniref:LptF/LptG family permease n=1 Tax=Acetobacter sp. TaxID=440 RepID=UPI0025B99029|nr:LptF/LptG family permease [Acetobacter sp.]MCH4092004.1 LptF/LptG family permease [Acetobacter sp.]MCI1300742.1 LptF/LptG family permease [Acetobacter sp.]MCI1317506.1 LptF/LptG family permease [Acetobacter sp.]